MNSNGDSELQNDNSSKVYNSQSFKSSSFRKIKLAKRGNCVLRQELESYSLPCTPKCGIICNIFLIIIFLICGLPIILLTKNHVEYKYHYTDCSAENINNNKTCFISVNITEKLISPVFIYYELENFYLNHRALVMSKVWGQLRGEIDIDNKINSNCMGAVYIWEIFGNDSSKYKSFTGFPIKHDAVANPCGLIAKAFFNDTYSMRTSLGNKIPINETRISNLYEKDNYFKKNQKANTTQWIDVENEHFINWMAIETFSNFRKLWGRIEEDLDPDVYKLEVEDNYNISQYNANKSIVFATTTAIGQSNFYGCALVSGAVYLSLVSIFLWIFSVKNANKKFDYSNMKWS